MASEPPAARAWRALCHHLDGLAIGTTVEALDAAGAFASLAEADTAVAVEAVANRHGLAPGPLSVALRLLACQGILELAGEAQGAATRFALTPDGQTWLREVARYRGYAARLEHGARLRAALAGRADPSAPPPLPDAAPTRVRHHLVGPAVAAALVGLSACGALSALAQPGRPAVLVPFLDGPGDAIAAALHVLAAEGWIEGDGALARLTEDGAAAAAMAGQYAYAVGYVPTLLHVPALLHGAAPQATQGGTETHLDRGLDIAFSGEVFRRTCRTPFLELALPLFDTAPFDAQPAAVVDTGAGDGTLLVELFEAIRTRTARGRALDRHPLALIAAEPSAIARETAARRLAEAGATAHVFPADIGAPAAIAAELARRGIDPMAALHVNKSVLHDRSYADAPPFALDSATGTYALPDGRALGPAQVAGDLVRLFKTWMPFLARHGMIAIEAHTAHPALSAARIGASIMTVLDAGHGYSCQYLLEAAAHRACARAAGLRSKGSRDLAATMIGQPVLTIDHWTAAR